MLLFLSSIAFFIALLLISVSLLLSFLNYLSKPKDLKAAKVRGEQLVTLQKSTVMVVVGHPDDADFYAGGTLNLLHQRGNKVIAIIGTSGEKGGDLPNLGKVREKEQLEAAKQLGYDKVIFLRFPDRGLKANKAFESSLSKLINKYKPSVVFTFDTIKEGYIYRHSDHEAAGQATIEVLKNRQGIKLYLFHSSQNDVIVDVSPVQKLKIKALAVHKSQRVNNRFNKYRRLFLFLWRRPAGSAQDFSSVGIRYGEMFRLQAR